MRMVAILLFLVAAYLAVDAVRDQRAGVATATAPRSVVAEAASRDADPEGFRGLMAYQWIRVALCAGAGYAFWQLASWSKRNDPFAPKAP